MHADVSNTVTAAVIALREEFIAKGAKSAQEINQGSCEDFACELVSLLNSNGISSAKDISVNEYLQSAADADDNNYGYPFDREELENEFPGFKPPSDLGLDDLDDISSFASFSPGTHIWTFCNGLHYDAEAPEGVKNFLELPFFQRIITKWIDNGRPSRPEYSVGLPF